jgi:two-component system sensor histidine kinase SenX3
VPSKWLSATVVPAGGDGAVLVVVTDVTDSKRLEAVRRDFVANASHELKTPAASIRAAAETILDAAEDDLPAIPRFARQLEREAARLSQIVEDLLDLSRLESGSDLAEDVRVDSLVRDVALRVADRVREARVSLVVHADKRCVVKGSAQDLSLLVGNLLDNAIRHTQAGGSITVSVDCDQASVSLTVSDTGIGIPSKDLPRVFERFYRVDRARSRETGGTGLGLSIVKHVAENHGGSVEVQSELAAGTTFTVLLPLAGE